VELLDLRRNRLKHLDGNVMNGVFNLIYIYIYINLDYNTLQYLHPDTFLLLPNIHHVYSYSNPDLQIPTDRHLINSRSLPHIDISACVLSSLFCDTCAKVCALKWLDMTYNILISVDINIWRALPQLSTFYP